MSKGFWDSKTPIAIAHRGGAGTYDFARFRRENTPQVFKAAQKLGYEYFELDVVSTADNKVIVLHVTTDRFEALLHKPSAPNAKKIQGYTYGELTKKLGRDIPLLEDIFRDFPATKFLIDAKTDEVVEPLAKTVVKAKAFQRVFLNSFYLHRVTRLQQILDDKVSYGLIIGRYPRLVNRKLLGLLKGKYTQESLQAIVLPYRFINRHLADFIHQEGLKLVVWTPNTSHNIERSLVLGSDGIISDNIKLLKRVMAATPIG